MRSFQLEMEGFRGFKSSGPLKIRPLTFFVGENSAGKTSALAAINYALRLNEDQILRNVNIEPFDLGSFDQIAYRGRDSSEYAKQFTISVQREIKPDAEDGSLSVLLRNEKREKSEKKFLSSRVSLRVSMLFSSRIGNAEISLITSSIDNDHLILDLADGSLSVALPSRTSPISLIDDKLAKSFASVRASLHSDVRVFGILMSFTLDKIRKSSEKIEEDQFSKEETLRIERLFRSFFVFLSSQPEYVYASAPTRSIPERVYSSSNVSDTPDGRATPYTLRERKASGGRDWNRLFADFKKFGQNTGMFSSIDIKRLTSDIAGPFQVKVRIEGRTENIIDVGYGVSQSIPFVAELAIHNDEASFLIQQPEVHLHPKAQAGLGTFMMSYINSFKRNSIVVETHSDYIIDRVRQHIRLGDIDKSMVSLVFFDKGPFETKCCSIEFDERGDPVDPPENYRSFFLREQMAMLGL